MQTTVDSNAAADQNVTRFDVSVAVHTIEVHKKYRTVCLVGFLSGNENFEVRQTMVSMIGQKFNETLDILSARAMRGELAGLHLYVIGE